VTLDFEKKKIRGRGYGLKDLKNLIEFCWRVVLLPIVAHSQTYLRAPTTKITED